MTHFNKCTADDKIAEAVDAIDGQEHPVKPEGQSSCFGQKFLQGLNEAQGLVIST